MRRAILAVLLLGCSEEPQLTAAPLPSTPPERPLAVEQEPSPYISSPHVRSRAHGRASADSMPDAPIGMGGGGGGGGQWTPRTERAPTEREVAEYRRRMEQEMGERPPQENERPCDRYLDVLRANAAANDQPGQDVPDGPSRAELRENCRHLPESFRDCLSPEYFRDHADECQEQIAEMGERGERRSRRAQRELEAIRGGRQPWPGQQEAPPRPRGDEEDG
jgi:hypothetical protein